MTKDVCKKINPIIKKDTNVAKKKDHHIKIQVGSFNLKEIETNDDIDAKTEKQ